LCLPCAGSKENKALLLKTQFYSNKAIQAIGSEAPIPNNSGKNNFEPVLLKLSLLVGISVIV
jgi:hypothetical protein